MAKLMMAGNDGAIGPDAGRLAVAVGGADDLGTADVRGRPFVVLVGAGAVVGAAVPAGTVEAAAGGAVLVAWRRGEET